MSNTKVYEIITEQIIRKLEEGTIPWRKPWVEGENNIPTNLKSKKAYRGINVFLLGCMGYGSKYWVTYKQAAAMGGQVRKGEKSAVVVFWKWIEKKDVDGAVENRFPLLRYYRVFNSEQCDGLEVPEPTPAETLTDSPSETAKAIVDSMPNKPDIITHGQQACYTPALDTIYMPKRDTFSSEAGYCSTLFHELAHSTGHKTRLDRDLSGNFGSESYSKEELVAEFAASYLNAVAGIEDDRQLDNAAAYIKTWISRLQSAPMMVVCAAGAAQKAADHILGVAYGEQAIAA